LSRIILPALYEVYGREGTASRIAKRRLAPAADSGERVTGAPVSGSERIAAGVERIRVIEVYSASRSPEEPTEQRHQKEHEKHKKQDLRNSRRSYGNSSKAKNCRYNRDDEKC
jgi:hypothetical protein